MKTKPVLTLVKSSPKKIKTKKRNEMQGTMIKGEAVCLQCKHEWDAIFPIGSSDFKCPKCNTYKGVMKYFVEIRNEHSYSCGECNNNLFFLLDHGVNQCPMCGTIIEQLED